MADVSPVPEVDDVQAGPSHPRSLNIRIISESPAFAGPDYDYPLLLLPKTGSNIAHSPNGIEELFVNATIYTRDSEGNECVLYSGFLNIRFSDNHSFKFETRTVQETPENGDRAIMSAADQKTTKNFLTVQIYDANVTNNVNLNGTRSHNSDSAKEEHVAEVMAVDDSDVGNEVIIEYDSEDQNEPGVDPIHGIIVPDGN